jgi:hypothetical protein
VCCCEVSFHAFKGYERELATAYRNDSFASVKTVYAPWNWVKGNKLENAYLEVHMLLKLPNEQWY